MNPVDRERVGWWAFVLVLGGVAAFVAYSFVGLIVLGVFGYYAMRPICARLRTLVDSRSLAATLTVLAVLIPVLLLFVLAGVQLLAQAQQALGDTAIGSVLTQVAGLDAVPEAQREQLLSVVQDPMSLLDGGVGSVWSNLQTGLHATQALFGGLLLLSLSATLSYVLLANDQGIADGLVRMAGGRDSAAYGYAAAVDADLESVFFGNLLFVVFMAVVATVTYAATNFLAPAGLHVPMVVVLGFLTGLASLIPVVVGKVVYLPVVGYLALQASGTGGTGFAFVGITLVAYLFVLDLLPQSVVQPYLTGRRLDPMILLFAYLLGPTLFGWYGFFLMPILFVLILEAYRIVLPDLVRGNPVRPEAAVARDVGTDPSQASQRSEDRSGMGSDDPDPDSG